MRRRSSRCVRTSIETLAFEALEARRLLTTTVAWHTTGAFDQFTGGAPKVQGFGIDDGEPDANGDGISDVSGIAKAPRFAGFEFDTGYGSYDFGIGNVHASASGKFGVNYGYYLNGGTATTIHSGTFSYDVAPADASGKIAISTSEQPLSGDLFTASPTLSAYADLVAQFHADIGATFYSLFPFFYDDLHLDVPINIPDIVYPLASFNRQVLDPNGKPELDANGTPKFDGDITFLLTGLTDAGQHALTDLLRPGQTGIQSQYQDDLRNERNQFAKIEEAKVELQVAQANGDTDAALAAQAGLNTAQGAYDAAVADADRIKAAVNEFTKTGAQFGGGEIIQARIGTADGPLLGITGTVGVGVGIPGTNGVNVGETLGSAAITLPEINLITRTPDANGVLSASTSDQNFQDDTDLVARQQAVNFTLNLGALIGGVPTLNLGPISINATLINYVLSLLENVTQDVSLTPTASDTTVIYNFVNPSTHGPLAITAYVNGVKKDNVTSITFHAGDRVQIQPAAGATIQVDQSLRHGYDFTNTLGLELALTGEFQALGLSVTAFRKTLLTTGYAYDSDSSKLASADLGPIWSVTFHVTENDVSVGSFQVAAASADLQLTATSVPDPVGISDSGGTYALTYTFEVKNDGPLVAKDVVFTDEIPSTFALNPGQSSAGVGVSSGVASLNLGTLAVGATRSIMIAVDATIDTSLSAFSFVNVTSLTPDGHPSDNSTFVRTDFNRPIRYLIDFRGDDPNVPVIESQFHSLRHFAAEAEAHPGPDRIVYTYLFQQGPTVHSVDYGEIDFTQSIDIYGSRTATPILDPHDNSRIFRFGATGRNDYLIYGVNFINGTADMGGAIELDDPDGTDPAKRDTLTILYCTFDGNSATTGLGYGGAIDVHNANLVITDSTFKNNDAKFGGAIHVENGTVTFKGNVTVSSNQGTSAGGGVFVRAASGETTALTVYQSLFQGNDSTVGEAIRVRADSGGTASATYSQSIFNGGTGSNEVGSIQNGGTTALTSGGNNVSDDTSGNLNDPTDRKNTTAGITISKLKFVDKPDGSTVGVLGLIDPRFPDDPTFTVDDSRFAIDGNTLKFKPGQSPLAEDGGTITVNVTASDDPYSVAATFVLNVIPQNLAPTDIQLSKTTVYENTKGAQIGVLTDTDPNTADSARYTVDDHRFRVVGGILGLKPKQSLDFEAEPTVLLKISVRDHGGLTFTEAFTVRVLDVNEVPSSIQFDATSLLGGTAGAVVGKVIVTDPDQAASPPTITVDDPRFEVAGGILKLKAGQSLDRATTPFVDLIVTATDSGGLSISSPLQVRVAPNVSVQGGSGLLYTERAAATPLAVSAGIQGVAGDTYNQGALMVQITQNAQPADRLVLADQGGVGVAGNVVSVSGKRVGTLQGGVGSSPLFVLFDSTDANADAISALIRAVGFRADGVKPSTAARTIAFTFVDAEGKRITAGSPITVGVVNLKRFTLTAPATSLTVKPRASLAFKRGAALKIAGNTANRLISVVVSVSGGTLSTGKVKGLKVSGKGKAKLGLTGTLAQVNAGLASLALKAPKKAPRPITLNLAASDLGPAGSEFTEPESASLTIRLTSTKATAFKR